MSYSCFSMHVEINQTTVMLTFCGMYMTYGVQNIQAESDSTNFSFQSQFSFLFFLRIIA